MSDRQLKGIGVSPGIGVGAASVVLWTMPEVPHRVVPRSQVEKEVRRLRAAVKDVKRYLQDMRAKAEDRAGVDEARIFDAQILMLEDKEFLSGVADLIRENHLAAEKAYEFKALEVRDMWAATGSPRLKDRLADLSGVAVRVIEHLMHRGSDELGEVVAQPALTTDGVRVALRGNVDLPDEIKAAQDHRAEGVGLLRTEFLITSHTTLPDEEEQAAYFTRVGKAFPGHPVVIRTYDLGGDKLPGPFRVQAEANPQLGWRAIRVCLDRPEIFRTQIRAALRAARHADIQLMIPLVTRLDELDRTRAIVAEEATNLARDGVAAATSVPVGVMVETPAAAVMADQLAKASDFLSVGTNDLTQYTLAVDRGNARLADRFNPHDPSVLRLLKMVADAARAAGKAASVCGEMASEPLSAFLLIGLGYETLSVAPAALPRVKWTVRRVR